ncbi:DUF1232 domain-containing protein [Leptolyngbya sp. FACHB-36]|uniref:YkvA family protein n=1 Tax=Leptolyngbya sp. FACHB-36 TaxID=2692808 RepID=UPI001681A1FF|nr:YkvA family protein [Leptolyngbya sp. FACHB-36]MBD2019436.1 DUF1232 domain-containing protein [Leptolyngbya sp. FACHB-36]
MNISQSIYNWYRNSIRNPKYRWWIILGSLAYLLSPIDISPDFIPVIGWIDDGVIATLLMAEVSQLLVERLKSGKGETQPTTETQKTEAVDVNAVSVEQ